MEVTELLKILKAILLTLGLEEIKLETGTYKTKSILEAIDEYGSISDKPLL